MHLARRIFGASAAVAMFALVRCGGGKECATSSDCDTGQTCVFGEHAGCASKGTCASRTDNCDSTFVRQVCGCKNDLVTEVKCTDIAGFAAPVASAQHCFDPDTGVLNPDASDDAPVIPFDASRDTAADTSIDDASDATTDVRDAGRG